MYMVSTEYLTHIDNSITRTPCSKIVVDGVEYSGRTHLKTYPKISHVNSSMIGGFPAATCEFEIYNIDGNIVLNGNEIEVFRGLEINGDPSWIPMGFFSASDDNITNNKTARTVTFKGYDRAALFDVAFEQGEDITFPCTLLNFVQKLCARRGVALENADFPMAELTIETAPNIPSNYTERQLISCAAELGGCIARINRSGNLEISKPYSTGRKIPRARYSAVSKEPVFGPINSVVLGREGYNDDIVYPAAAPDNLCEWRIEDNPFVENRREELIADIAANIIGMSFVPFKITDCVEDYIFDINDSIEIESKDGTIFTATILSKTTSSRIRSELKAETQKSSATNRKIAGSIKDAVKRVQLDVDHQNNRINALVEDSVSRMELELLSDSINIRFEDIESPDTVENVKNAVTSITKDGVNIENGALTLTDDSGNVLIGVNTDENGDMYVSGKIRANSLEADSVTSDAIKSGAITADKLSVGKTKRENLFYNPEFTENYSDGTTTYAEGWRSINGTLTPKEGWIILRPNNSTSNSGVFQSVWLKPGVYSIVAQINLYNVSSISSSGKIGYILGKASDGDFYYDNVSLNIGNSSAVNQNKEINVKYVVNYAGDEGFVDVGLYVNGMTFSGYVSIAWMALFNADEEFMGANFYSSDATWLKSTYKSSNLLTYASNLNAFIHSVNPFTVNSDGELDVIGGNIGCLKFSRLGLGVESHVSDSIWGLTFDGSLNISKPTGAFVFGEDLNSDDLVGMSKAFAPSMDITSDTDSRSFVGIYGYYCTDGEYSSIIRPQKVETTGTMEAIAFNNTSKEETKKDIATKASVLEKLKKSQIYEYAYKQDGKTARRKTGFIIERETPEEIISDDGNGINLYSMAAMNWKATQEILERLEEVEKTVKHYA